MAKKEMTIVELKDKLGLLSEERKGIFDKLKIEGRKTTTDEEKRLGEIVSEVAEAEFEILLAEARNKQKPVKTQKRNTENGSMLLMAIRSAAEGTASDELQMLCEAGKAEMRAAGVAATGNVIVPMEMRGDNVQATVTGDGKEIVTEETMNILGPIRDRLVLVQAGATFLSGLKGNIGMPSYSGSNANWEGEVTTAKNGKGTFAHKIMSPKRLATYVDVSKQFLAQDTVGAGALLMSDIANAVSVKLQSTILGKHAADAKIPDGFFTGITEYAMSGAATLGGIVEMETLVETDAALYANLAYIMGPKARGVLKTALKAANVAEGFLFEKGMVNDYKTFITSGMPGGFQTAEDEEGIIFGNWADLIIGQWGGLDITVDPYTKAAEGMVRLVINGYFDATVRRETSFAVGSLK